MKKKQRLSPFGRLILREVKKKGQSRRWVAQRITQLYGKSMNPSTVTHLMSGRTQWPKFNNGVRILLALGVSLEEYAEKMNLLPPNWKKAKRYRQQNPDRFAQLLAEAPPDVHDTCYAVCEDVVTAHYARNPKGTGHEERKEEEEEEEKDK